MLTATPRASEISSLVAPAFRAASVVEHDATIASSGDGDAREINWRVFSPSLLVVFELAALSV